MTFDEFSSQKDNTDMRNSHHDAETTTRSWQRAIGYTLNALLALLVHPDMHADDLSTQAPGIMRTDSTPLQRTRPDEIFHGRTSANAYGSISSDG